MSLVAKPCEGHRGECFIHFVHVDVVNSETGAVEYLLRCRDDTGEHLQSIAAHRRDGYDSCARGGTKSLSPYSAGDEECTRAIGEW